MKTKFNALAFAVMTALSLNATAKDDVLAVEGEFLIQFSPDATNTDKARVLKRIDAQEVENVKDKKNDHNGRKGDLVLIRHHQPQFSRDEAKKALEADPAVELVEPNYIYTHQAVANDAKYSSGELWGMYSGTSNPANAYGSAAADAWAAGKTDCSSVYVGIIDEGYMYTHEDLQANAGVNSGEIAGDKKDNDGNGLVDDVYGWDFDGNNNTVFDGINDDHGTHVAGTIGAVGGNGKGVAGVCWNVKLLNAKFLGSRGGTLANAIKAVDYFTALKTRTVNPLNIVATNNSWGGGAKSDFLSQAIERANQAGILFVAAAGNETNNNDANPSYPASYTNSNVISVAALTSTGGLATFSNYGATSVHLAAAGQDIVSTVPVKSGKNIVSGYAKYSGTSMATPHVTGAVALYAATHSNAPVEEIKNAILNAVIPTSAVSDKTATGGRLNVSSF